MSEMVERVSKALEKKMTKEGFLSYEDAAHAAIEAMRDIDNDCLEAMHVAMFTDKFNGHSLPMLGAGWEAAIDAALEQKS